MNAGLWVMALRNLSRNRRRNFATGAAIGLGFAALIALGGFTSRSENHLRVYTVYANRIGHLNIFKAGGLEHFSSKPKKYSLTEQELKVIQDVIKTSDNIDIHGAQMIGTGIIGNGCRTLPFIANAIDPQVDLQLRNHAEMRRWVPDMRTFNTGRGLWNYSDDLGAVALSTGLARLLGKTRMYEDFGDNHKPVLITDCGSPDLRQKLAGDSNVQLVAGSWSGMMAAQDAEVVATFDSAIAETANAAILTSLKQLQRLYDTPNATFYSVWLKNPSQLKQAIASFRQRLADAGLQTEIYPWTDEGISPFYAGVIQFLYVMVTFLAFVLALVVGFSIFNSATMTIIERSSEIGMMRSMGFTRRQVRILFVAEMFLLSLLSIVIGGLVSVGGVLLVNHLQVHYSLPGIARPMTLQLVADASIVLKSALAVLVLAIGTSLFAVWKVVKGNIAVLLLGAHQ